MQDICRAHSWLKRTTLDPCIHDTRSLQVFGVIGNPVSHSRSPSLHNAAFASAGVDAVYIPLLVDDVASFLRASALPGFDGFSVTIPHKVRALSHSKGW